MDNQQIELTAYCGLYCGDCPRYRSKALGLARTLGDELQAMRFGEYVEVKSAFMKELGHYAEFLKVLDAIARLRCDTPCRAGGDGCLQACDIKVCVQAKNFEGCWQCDEFELCGKFESLEPFSSDIPRENLRRIREYGIDRWAEHRGKFYAWL
jgi:hypothetical protein